MEKYVCVCVKIHAYVGTLYKYVCKHAWKMINCLKIFIFRAERIIWNSYNYWVLGISYE